MEEKNGEAIYIGTSSNQWDDGKNPTNDPDESNNNWVHDNTINTQGNECVAIKEGATQNIMENNSCTGQLDPNSAGFDSRSDGNIFRLNESYGNLGAGVRLGGWSVGGVQYGKNNDVYNNNIHDNAKGGIKFQVTPQGKICGNTMANNAGGNSVGSYGSQFNPTEPCPDSPDTTKPSVSTTSPADGDTVSGTETITTEATDNVSVTKVELYVSNILLSTDTSTPYSFTWDTTTFGNTTHSLLDKAYDVAGNTAIDTITVTVNNSSPPPPPPPPGKLGDINGDGKINIFDLSVMLSKWESTNKAADLNNSGRVDIFDLSILLSRWGR